MRSISSKGKEKEKDSSDQGVDGVPEYLRESPYGYDRPERSIRSRTREVSDESTRTIQAPRSLSQTKPPTYVSIAARSRPELKPASERRYSSDSVTSAAEPIHDHFQKPREAPRDIDSGDSAVHKLEEQIVPVIQDDPVRAFNIRVQYLPNPALPYPSEISHSFHFERLSKISLKDRDFFVRPGTSLETGCGVQDYHYHYHPMARMSTLHQKCPYRIPVNGETQPNHNVIRATPSTPGATPPQKDVGTPTRRYVTTRSDSSDWQSGSTRNVPSISVNSPEGTSVRVESPISPTATLSPTDEKKKTRSTSAQGHQDRNALGPLL